MEKLKTKDKIIYWGIIPLIAAFIPIIFGWQSIARLNGWIPLTECPNSPLEVSIISPGNEVQVPVVDRVTGFELYNTSIIVEPSREIDDEINIGLLTKGEKDNQFNLQIWTGGYSLEDGSYRKYSPRINLDNISSSYVEVRAVLLKNKGNFGEHYSEISEITRFNSFLSISEPIKIFFKK